MDYISSTLKFIEDYANAYVNNSNLYGYNIRTLFNSVSIFIMPMVNPDGVNIATNSLPTSSPAYRMTQNISNSYPQIPFPTGWKANARGVDLNLQFPARMGTGKANKIFSRLYFSCSS